MSSNGSGGLEGFLHGIGGTGPFSAGDDGCPPSSADSLETSTVFPQTCNDAPARAGSGQGDPEAPCTKRTRQGAGVRG